MNDLEPLCWFGFDRLDVSVLGEPGVYENIDPAIGRLHGNNDIFRQFHNEIRRDVPLILIFELPWWRHICRISALCTTVDPFRNGCDLLVGQRSVVLEVPDAHGFVDMPW